METILSMPLPMASALTVLMAIAAFFFIKVVALVITPSYSRRYLLVRGEPVAYDRRASPRPGRRISDRRTHGNAVAG